MFDLHVHLLPGVDDGPETMDQALALARHAVKNGIKEAVLTPHIHVGRYGNQKSSLQTVFTEFSQALAANGIDLKVRLGAEVRLGMEILELLACEEIPMLGRDGDYSVMLLEFPHSHIVPGTEKLVQFLLDKKIRPMIAHPERNKDVMRSLDKIRPFVDAGCLFQVTAGSLCGNFGKVAQTRAEEMLRQGWVTLLGSDGHNLKYRPPELAPGLKIAEKIIGSAAARAMVLDRPAAILGIAP